MTLKIFSFVLRSWFLMTSIKTKSIHGRWFMINTALKRLTKSSTKPGKIPEFFRVFLERKYQFPLLRSIKSDDDDIWLSNSNNALQQQAGRSPLILRILDKIRWFNRYTTGRSYFLRHPNFSEKRASPAHESFYCIPSCLNKKQRNLLNSKKLRKFIGCVNSLVV